MSTQEHLNKIVAKCRELLAIAEKRTWGAWGKRDEFGSVYAGFQNRDLIAVCSFTNTIDQEKRNATFISSCAGRAEAGWKATSAACEAILRIADFESREVKEIIDAWPEDLL